MQHLIVTINEEERRSHLDDFVTGVVEEMQFQLPDAEAEILCQVQRYQRRSYKFRYSPIRSLLGEQYANFGVCE